MKTKKNVLFLNSSVSGGGAGKQLISLVRGLDKTVIDAHVALPFDGVVGGPLRDANAQIHYLPLLPERFGKTYLKLPKFMRTRFIERLTNVALFPTIIWKLRRLVLDLDIDVIYANHLIHFPIGLGLARITRRPVVFHSREIFSHPIARWYFRWLAEASPVKSVFCSSKGTAKLYEPTGKTHLVYDRLALEDHCRHVEPKFRKEFSIPEDAKIIGFMGRLVEWKGVKLLIEAFSRVAKQDPNSTLVIVGGNDPGNWRDLEKEYKDYAKSLGIQDRVIFTGFVSDPRPYAVDFDIFVLPSIEPEPFGMVTIEAMAFGVPPVVSKHGGAIEIVTHEEDGLHFQPRNADSLAEELLRLLKDPELRHRLGEKARRTVFDRFDSTSGKEEVTDSLLKILGSDQEEPIAKAS